MNPRERARGVARVGVAVSGLGVLDYLRDPRTYDNQILALGLFLIGSLTAIIVSGKTLQHPDQHQQTRKSVR